MLGLLFKKRANDLTWFSDVKVKQGVSLDKLKPEILKALRFAYYIHKAFSKSITVTSTNDGKHMKTSKHYIDQAFDSRIWGIPKPLRVKIVKICSECLGKDYDIILESNHIHWEYDKKREG